MKRSSLGSLQRAQARMAREERLAVTIASLFGVALYAVPMIVTGVGAYAALRAGLLEVSWLAGMGFILATVWFNYATAATITGVPLKRAPFTQIGRAGNSDEPLVQWTRYDGETHTFY